MTVIMENHLKEMKGIFLDSKQEVIERRKYSKIIIWPYVEQRKQPFDYIFLGV